MALGWDGSDQQGYFNKEKDKLKAARKMVDAPQKSELYKTVDSNIDDLISQSKLEADPEYNLKRAMGNVESQIDPVYEEFSRDAEIRGSSLGESDEQKALGKALSERARKAYQGNVDRYKRIGMAQGYGVKSSQGLQKALQMNAQMLDAHQSFMQQLSEYNQYKSQQRGAVMGMISGFAGKWLGQNIGNQSSKSAAPSGGQQSGGWAPPQTSNTGSTQSSSGNIA